MNSFGRARTDVMGKSVIGQPDFPACHQSGRILAGMKRVFYDEMV
jgi:hypothetical protein